MAEEIFFNARGRVAKLEKFMQRFNLKNVRTIAVVRNKVQITMNNDEIAIVISEGYEIGTQGEASQALYRMLIAAGFSETESKTVFENGKTMGLFKKTTTN